MKQLAVVLAGLALIVGMASPAVAQSTYVGTDLAEGIFMLPEEIGPNSIVEFSANELRPNSEVQFEVVDENDGSVDGLAIVQGVVVAQANALGEVNVELRIPAGLDAGTFSIEVRGTRADGSPFLTSLPFQVAQSESGEVVTALALTGSSSSSRALGGFLLVALGAGLVGVAAMRRGESVGAAAES